MKKTASPSQESVHDSELRRLEQEALVQVLLEERDRLIERIANEGPRAALQWARDESMARAARGERLPEYCERLLSEPSSSDYDEDERKSKKRRVASPRHCAGGKLEPVSFTVPLGEICVRWCFRV